MSGNNIGVNIEIEKLKEECELLKNELIKVIAEKTHLTDVVAENIEAIYQTKIGFKEYELFCIQCEAARLKRKIELIVSKVNREEKVLIEDIEIELEREFKEWETKMKNWCEEIKYSNLRLNTLVSHEETLKIKKIYKELVKKLHPDINENLTEYKKNLWNRVSEAYKEGDFEELEAIQLILQDEQSGDDVDGMNGNELLDDHFERLTKRRECLKDKIKSKVSEIESLKKEFPFNIEKNIKDDKWVKAKVEELENYKTEVSTVISYLKDKINYYKTEFFLSW